MYILAENVVQMRLCDISHIIETATECDKLNSSNIQLLNLALIYVHKFNYNLEDFQLIS